MRRRLFIASWVASLVFAVASGVMWVRSHRTRDCVYASAAHRACALESDGGRLSVVITWSERAKPLGWHFARPQEVYWDPTLIPVAWAGLGFEGRREIGLPSAASARPRWMLSALTVPYWALVFLGLPAPFLLLSRRIRSRSRRREGRCAT